MRYTNEEIEEVREISMLTFLGDYENFEFDRCGSYYRCRDRDSLVIDDDEIHWFWNSRDIGGFGPIDYLIKIKKMPFREAMKLLNKWYFSSGKKEVPKDKSNCSCLFSLPASFSDNKRVWAYLCKTRGISDDVVRQLILDKLLYQDTKGNCVFVGQDQNGVAKYAALRGTLSDVQFRMEYAGSDKRYGFRFGNYRSEEVYVFESPIDAMSYASIHSDRWHDRAYLSLGGVLDNALAKYLKMFPQTKRIILCLDNDTAGNTACKNTKDIYEQMGYTVERDCPNKKDWNEDLLILKENFQLWKRK